MIFKVLTLFPEFFQSPLETGLLGKAVERGLINVDIRDIRAYTRDSYRKCDDYPYGGGCGMVLMPEPLEKAILDAKGTGTKVILTSAGGRPLDQDTVKSLSREKELCLVCGHYEGVDQRIIDRHVDLEVSIGDFVLSGGEFAAIAIIDAVARYVPGFMSNEGSLDSESFEEDLLEHPHYTRPVEFDGMRVPEVLIGGNHAEIARWRLERSIEKTRLVRPDLYRKYLRRKLLGE